MSHFRKQQLLWHEHMHVQKSDHRFHIRKGFLVQGSLPPQFAQAALQHAVEYCRSQYVCALFLQNPPSALLQLQN